MFIRLYPSPHDILKQVNKQTNTPATLWWVNSFLADRQRQADRKEDTALHVYMTGQGLDL
jgi:hypothetical protein